MENTAFSLKPSQFSDHGRKRFLCLLTHDDWKSNYIVATKTGDTFSQHAYRSDVLRDLDLCGAVDTFVTHNGFNGAKRDSNRTRQINSLFFDIDIHNDDADLVAVKQQVKSALFNVIDNAVLPTPTMIVDSGRGFHLYYLFARSVPYRKRSPEGGSVVCEKALWRIKQIEHRIDGVLDKICASIREAGNDRAVHDLARIARIPGTYNTSSHSYAELIYANDEAMYNFEMLESALPSVDTSITAPNKVVHVIDFERISIRRLKELEQLRDYRDHGQGEPCTNNTRNNMVFVYMNAATQVYGIDKAFELAKAFNRGFAVPLPEMELKATRDNLERKGTYRIKLDTIITKFLKITQLESDHLGLFKSKRTLDRELAKQKTREKRAKRDRDILELVSEGMTYDQVAKRMGVSRRTVASVVKRNNGARTYARRTLRRHIKIQFSRTKELLDAIKTTKTPQEASEEYCESGGFSKVQNFGNHTLGVRYLSGYENASSGLEFSLGLDPPLATQFALLAALDCLVKSSRKSQEIKYLQNLSESICQLLQ